jgi:hypothetical protein
MSKIAEEKALEAYPVNEFFNNESGMLEDSHRELRIGYEEGYDQAFQDFLEKAERWLSKNARNYYSAYATSDKLIEQFKNYMQDESKD